MKRINLIIVTFILSCLFFMGIDFYSINLGNKPIFVLYDKNDNKYKGLFYDVYYCDEYSSPQIKFKLNKFSCPLNVNNEEVKDNKNIAKLTLVGDLLFEQPFYDAVDKGYDKNEYFSLVKDYFKNDDLSIGNMEVVIGNDNLKSSGVGYNFCAPEYVGHLVNTLDFEILGTSNNHAFDRGLAGINSSIDFFRNNTNIEIVGTYKNKSDRNNLRILEINDIKFGFLAYTYGTNQKVNDDESKLIGYYKNPQTKEISLEYKNLIKEEIENIKNKSDVVIIIMHWGDEFTYKQNKEQKEMAEFLNGLGVDIIVGSHSHSIQPIEIIGNEHKTLVYYSLGNFVSADDDIARTPLGDEEFDNAYQVGLISTLSIIKDNDKIIFQDISAELTINYFDKNMNNFKIVPFKDYNDSYEKTHFRYSKGLTKDFINNIYEKVIDEKYRI